MKHNWKISVGPRLIDSGTVEADTEREAMTAVLAEQGDGKDGDTSYSITAGSISMSSYGDEFTRSAEVMDWSGEPDMEGGHTFRPKLSDVVKDTAVKALERLGKEAETASERLVKTLAHHAAKASARRAIEQMIADGPTAKDVADRYRKTLGALGDKYTNVCPHNQPVTTRDMRTGQKRVSCVDCGEVMDEEEPHRVVPVACHHFNTTQIRDLKGNSTTYCLDCGQTEPPASWNTAESDPLEDIDAAKGPLCGIDRATGKDWSVMVTNGIWTDAFTPRQAAKVRGIVASAHHDPSNIQGVIREEHQCRWRISGPNWQLTVSDELL